MPSRHPAGDATPANRATYREIAHQGARNGKSAHDGNPRYPPVSSTRCRSVATRRRPQEIASKSASNQTVTPLLTHRPTAVDRAFERLYKKHVHAVYRYTLAVLHNEADAEDVTQTTFLSAYRAFQTRRAPRAPAQLADQDRPQRVPPALPRLVAPPARGRASATRAQPRRPRRATCRPPTRSAARSGSSASTSAPRSSCASSRAARTPRSPGPRTSPSALSRHCSSAPAARCASSSKAASRASRRELTLSRLDEGSLAQRERGGSRAHLRECKECAVARAPAARPARRAQEPRRGRRFRHRSARSSAQAPPGGSPSAASAWA